MADFDRSAGGCLGRLLSFSGWGFLSTQIILDVELLTATMIVERIRHAIVNDAWWLGTRSDLARQ